MLPNFRNISTALACLLAGIAPIAGAKPAKLEPTYYFTTPYALTKFASFGEAYQAAVAHNQATIDATTGKAMWRIVGVQAAPSPMLTMNGLTIPAAKWEVLQRNPATGAYDIWIPGSNSALFSRGAECPAGYRLDAGYSGPNGHISRVECTATEPEPEPPCDPCEAKSNPIPQKNGNPIYPSTGLKEQVEVDYVSRSAGGLKLVRTYRSDRNAWEHNYSFTGMDMRPKTDSAVPVMPVPERPRNAQCYKATGSVLGQVRCYRPMYSGLANDFSLQRGNSAILRFGTATNLAPTANVNDRWTPVLDTAQQVIANDIYNSRNDSTERYDLNGRLERITSRNGHVMSFAHIPFDGTGAEMPAAVLSTVTDHFGKALTFTYDGNGRLHTMTTPNEGKFIYAYDEASSINGTAVGNLTSVTYPGGKKRIYWYNEPANTTGAVLPFALTGITDENGTRYATFKYDAAGKAISTEYAGGVNKYQVTRTSPIRVTDPLGAERSYQYTTIFGTQRVVSETQPAGAGSPAASRSVTYDANGNVETSTDFRGTVTRYTYYLDRNLEKTSTEASGTAEQRVTTTEWHPSFQLPLRVSAPKQLTTYTYYDNGELKSRSVRATTDLTGALGFAAPFTAAAARTMNYTYNANWQLKTVTGPVTGNSTSYDYDPVSGNLLSITNALGHITRFDEYDGDGQPKLVTQPNGVTTRMDYTPRGWVETMTVSKAGVSMVTRYEHDDIGQVKKITLPGNVVINNGYDDAHRLTDIWDSLGNKIHYELDAMGNRIKEEVNDPSGVLSRQAARKYDVLNRIKEQTGAAQ